MPESDDIVDACIDLVGRCGASGLQIGHLHDDAPVAEAGWYAYAQYRGARITVEDHQSPTLAALALAQRLLQGAACRCGETVSLSDDRPGCRWRLVGARWEPGCDVPPITVTGSRRGDYAALVRAMGAGNRAERRGMRGV